MAGTRERWERYREVERRKKEKAKELQGEEAFRKKRGKKGRKAPDTALSFSRPSLWSKVEMANKSSLQREGSCGRPGLCLLPGSRSELGVGSKAAMGAGDLPQKG